MNIERIEKVGVVGWERTGVALANLLLSLKKRVKVTEIRERRNFSASVVDEFQKRGVEFEFGGHSENFLKDCQLIILSPGVDLKTSAISNIAAALSIPYVGEIEFCFWLTAAKFIAITGTNGKTTTVSLLHQVLKERRKRVFLGGNIGLPLSSFVLQAKRRDLIVLEISSFQLETILEFRPLVASILNIEPDHLDRYSNFKDYFDAKLGIFRNQKEDDWAVLNEEVPLLKGLQGKLRAKIVYFSSLQDPSGKGNENFAGVYKIASLFGVSKDDCLKVFSVFAGLPHRMEYAGQLNGIKFINDSKATNPASTIWALKNLKTPIILIAGGKDKGLNYCEILPYTKKVKKINLFGESANKIKEMLNNSVATQIFSSLEDVVRSSFEEASSGDTVLFSPMCSSFDMFRDYIERGQCFKEIVKGIIDVK